MGVLQEVPEDGWEEFQRICAIAPQLRPVYIDFISACLEGERLMAAPAAFGAELSKASHPMLIGGAKSTAGMAILQSAFTSYLAARSAMIDRAKRYLSRTFGNPSPEFDDYVGATRSEYDGHFSYRLFSNLRNFSQHNEMPVSEMNLSGTASEDGGMKLSAEIIISKEKIYQSLLDEGKQPKFRNELLTLPDDNFEIVSIVKEDIASLHRLFYTLCSYHDDKLIQMSEYRDAIMDFVRHRRKKMVDGIPGSSNTDDFVPMLFIDHFLEGREDGTLSGKAKPILFGFDELDQLLGARAASAQHMQTPIST